MARCDEGYLCDVCGEEVKRISESDLYLRFVTGRMTSEQLLASPERHILCNPIDAQFIIDPEFVTPKVDGPFGRSQLDPAFVSQQEKLLTRGWRRLQELKKIARSLPIHQYPLPEFIGGKTTETL